MNKFVDVTGKKNFQSSVPLAVSKSKISHDEMYEWETTEYVLRLSLADYALVAGCRHFSRIDDAIRWWSKHSPRPEFVLALMALCEAVDNGEVFVTDDFGRKCLLSFRRVRLIERED